ncbi:MAG: ribosomal-processing cysteine protease Prp, partial [Synergistaceae bacterium]|nr:ribosomal-processing cysteine protease Prp [Synergistaceae bacterium]
MTRITLFWGDQGLLGLESRGHSGKKPKGENVVCAAVS